MSTFPHPSEIYDPAQRAAARQVAIDARITHLSRALAAVASDDRATPPFRVKDFALRDTWSNHVLCDDICRQASSDGWVLTFVAGDRQTSAYWEFKPKDVPRRR
jgi:hypothetical protein